MRRRTALGLAFSGAAAAALLLASRPGPPIRVEIPEGLSARQTAELLGAKRVVLSVPLFRSMLKLLRYDRRLKPGRYTLRVHEWPLVVARKIVFGRSDDVKIVIPEGFRAEQVAERLAGDHVVDAREFEELVRRRGLEGHLFPSTYSFPPGYGAEAALRKMVEAYELQIASAYARADPKPALPLPQTLTLASIVEREAVLREERPVIAAVYMNRLKKRMPLQADPTVQYALGSWKKGLTRADLKTPSPYNTYLRRGLPPGPICSPGLGSFRAALAPARTEALYFVADAKGGHIFSATNEEHAQARRLYKRALRKIKAAMKQAQAGETEAETRGR